MSRSSDLGWNRSSNGAQLRQRAGCRKLCRESRDHIARSTTANYERQESLQRIVCFDCSVEITNPPVQRSACVDLTEISESLRKPPGTHGRM